MHCNVISLLDLMFDLMEQRFFFFFIYFCWSCHKIKLAWCKYGSSVKIDVGEFYWMCNLIMTRWHIYYNFAKKKCLSVINKWIKGVEVAWVRRCSPDWKNTFFIFFSKILLIAICFTVIGGGGCSWDKKMATILAHRKWKEMKCNSDTSYDS